jgi:hypothetical protein
MMTRQTIRLAAFGIVIFLASVLGPTMAHAQGLPGLEDPGVFDPNTGDLTNPITGGTLTPGSVGGKTPWGELMTLLNIWHEMQKVNSFAGRVRDRMAAVYPPSVGNRINKILHTAYSIQDEVAQLSCGWQFSARTLRLKAMFDGGAFFCKPEIRLFHGSPTFLSDRDEYYDWKSALHLNKIAQELGLSQKRKASAAQHFRDTTIGIDGAGLSPEEAKRHDAIITAENADIQRSMVELKALDSERDVDNLGEKQRRKKQAERLGIAMIAGVPAEPNTVVTVPAETPTPSVPSTTGGA